MLSALCCSPMTSFLFRAAADSKNGRNRQTLEIDSNGHSRPFCACRLPKCPRVTIFVSVIPFHRWPSSHQDPRHFLFSKNISSFGNENRSESAGMIYACGHRPVEKSKGNTATGMTGQNIPVLDRLAVGGRPWKETESIGI